MKYILFSLALILPGFAQDQEDLITLLFETRDPTTYEAVYQKAEKAGISKQALIESRFLYLVDRDDQKALGAYSKELLDHLPNFKLEDSKIFSVPEDYQAITEYAQAIAELEKGDIAGFKKHITEAFWLSPSQAPVFGRHIDDIRMKESMKTLRFDFSRVMPSQKTSEKSQALNAYLGESPALLLHFWSPWAQESVDSLPSYYTTVEELKKHKIPSVSVLLAGNDESRQAGDQLLLEEGEKALGSWVVDTQSGALANLFRLSAFPTVVLVAKDGTILFNGNPADAGLWEKIKNLAPLSKKPDAAGK